MSKKNENVNPEIAMAKGISEDVSEEVSDALLDSNDNAGIESGSDNLSSSAVANASHLTTAHGGASPQGEASPCPTENINSSKQCAKEELVDLFVANAEVEEGAYFTLSINLKEFKIEFNKSNLVPAYVRDFYYSLNKDIAANNKKQNAFADKNPA